MLNFGFLSHKQKLFPFRIPYYIKVRYNEQGKREICFAANRVEQSVFTHVASIYANLLAKEIFCIRKEFNSDRIGLRRQHGRRFIVLGNPIWPPSRHVKTLYSDVACFTTHESNLSCNKSDGYRLRKVGSSSTFCKKICTSCARFTGPRQTCFAASDVTPTYSATPA